MTWAWPNSLMEFRACSDEIPPCSFETAGRLLWRNTNNELLPVYDRQLCECYLQPQILCFECLGDDKWFLISFKSEFVTQIWGKSSAVLLKYDCRNCKHLFCIHAKFYKHISPSHYEPDVQSLKFCCKCSYWFFSQFSIQGNPQLKVNSTQPILIISL